MEQVKGLVYDFVNAYEFGFNYPEDRDATIVAEENSGGAIADKITLVTPERTIYIDQHLSAEGDVYIDRMVSIGKDGIYKTQNAGETAKVTDLNKLSYKLGTIVFVADTLNYGGSFGDCIITANDVTGEAQLQGLLKYNGAAPAVRNQVIGKLPSLTYAPKTVQLFGCIGNGGYMRIDVDASGNIRWVEGSPLSAGMWVSLSNIKYNFKTTI